MKWNDLKVNYLTMTLSTLVARNLKRTSFIRLALYATAEPKNDNNIIK
jgi:hypothetical protein